jgi:hypothetical protein
MFRLKGYSDPEPPRSTCRMAYLLPGSPKAPLNKWEDFESTVGVVTFSYIKRAYELITSSQGREFG